MIRLAVVAGAPAWRAGLSALLGTAGGGPGGHSPVSIVCEAPGLAALAARDPEVDVLAAALEPPPVPGEWLALSGWLEQKSAAAPPGMVALCSTPELAPRLAELPLRAWGLLPLETPAEELQAALAAVYQGLVVGPAAWLNSLARSGSAGQLVRLPDTFALGAAALPKAPVSAAQAALTGREVQVLELLARGLANKQIAASLGISEHTVKFHITAIYQKLAAANRAEAVRNAVQQGLISI